MDWLSIVHIAFDLEHQGYGSEFKIAAIGLQGPAHIRDLRHIIRGTYTKTRVQKMNADVLKWMDFRFPLEEITNPDMLEQQKKYWTVLSETTMLAQCALNQTFYKEAG